MRSKKFVKTITWSYSVEAYYIFTKVWVIANVHENRLRSIVSICEEQFGFMKGKSTTGVIFALRQLKERYREGQHDLNCVFIDLGENYAMVPVEELYWCMRDKGYQSSVSDWWRTRRAYHQCESVLRCAAGTSEPFAVEFGLHQGSVFSPFLFSIMMDSLTEKKTLADDVRRWCGAVRKGERRAGVGTGAVEGSIVEERNESVKSKARVHVSQRNDTRKCYDAICQAATGHRIQISGKHPAQRWWHGYRNKQEDTVGMEQRLEDVRLPMYAIREYHHMLKDRITRWSFIQLWCTGWRQCQWLDPTWRNWKWQKWRCAVGRAATRWETFERNENINERLKIESITERCMKARLRCMVWQRT